jgi:hypothetical protein
MHLAVVYVNLLLAGLLAGAELLVCYGLRGPLNCLDGAPQVLMRQSLIRRLRIVVPSLYVPTVITSAAVAAMGGGGMGLAFRVSALAAIAAWTLATFLGTVPINKAALDWRPEAPPGDWRTLIKRWERLDLVRCWAAFTAFAALLAAAGTGTR